MPIKHHQTLEYIYGLAELVFVCTCKVLPCGRCCSTIIARHSFVNSLRKCETRDIPAVFETRNDAQALLKDRSTDVRQAAQFRIVNFDRGFKDKVHLATSFIMFYSVLYKSSFAFQKRPLVEHGFGISKPEAGFEDSKNFKEVILRDVRRFRNFFSLCARPTSTSPQPSTMQHSVDTLG